MIRITITPAEKTDTFSLLTQKELELRRRNKGTLHKAGPKKPGRVKWVHTTYPGWIQLQRCIGGITVALLQSKRQGGENQLLSSFVGFVDRHFHDRIAAVSISYEAEE